MNSTVLLLPLPLLIASTAIAQGQSPIVSPSHFAATEGQANLFPNNWPALCSNATPDRQQQVHDDLVGAGPRTIRGIAFRLDGTVTSATAPGFSAVVTVRMSHAATTAATMQPVFAANHGAGLITEANIPVTLPPVSWQGMPGPFVYRIDFSTLRGTTFAYDGVSPLCWDIEVTSHANPQPVRCDLVSGSAVNPIMSSLVLGTGCAAPGVSILPRLTTSQVVSWTATPPHIDIRYSANGLGTSSFAVLALGIVPFTPPVQLPIGHPGCLLHLSPLELWTVALANGATAAPIQVTLPGSSSFNGIDVLAQMATIDAGAWIVTNATQHNICAPFGPVPVSTLRMLGTNAPLLRLHEGSVVEFF